jgi:hypothetical protein
MASTMHNSNDSASAMSDVALLEMLAGKFGTDKLRHGYIPSYVKHVDRPRNERLVLVEIGLKKQMKGYVGCESLRMWREYFPEARIIGLDIIDVSTLPPVANTEVYQCDCTDAQAIEDVFSRHDIVPDLVIDDGAHTPKSHQIALGTIFPRMRAGGTYFIEDLQVCTNREMFKRWRVNDSNNTVTYLQDLKAGHAPQSLYLDSTRNAQVRNDIDSIYFENDMKLAVLKKQQ